MRRLRKVKILATLGPSSNSEDIIESLGGAERKLVGVVLDELNPISTKRQRDKQYA